MSNKKGRTAAVTGVAAVAVLAVLFGSGKLGFGNGVGLGTPAAAPEAAVTEAAPTSETPEITSEVVESQAQSLEIRVQGREYNYQNVTYGNKEHPLEELLEELKDVAKDTPITLIVEDNATKNAVDDLESALQQAGFQNIQK